MLMKVLVKAVDENGVEFHGEATLVPVQGEGDAGVTPKGVVATVVPTPAVDFSGNVRKFAKRYGIGMTGPKIFALIVAWMTKGNREMEVNYLDVEKLWNSMTSIFGIAFNPKYTTKAKEYGWVDSKRRGFYSVTDRWQEIFENPRLD